MAGFQWLGDRLRELSQLNNDSESADRGHFIEKLGKKINFIDCSFLENKKLGDLDLTPETWEEALDMHRAAFAKQKIYLRPRIFQKNALAQAPQQQQMEIERDGESQHSSPPSSSQRFTETQILYLRSQSAVRGVLQLHKLVTEKLEGYRILLRAEEVWAITKRSQLYSNFFTKLQDGLALDIAESWRLHVDTHMIRKSSYKGHGSKVAPNRIKIPFEGLTLPGAIFTASYVLQTRGCRPDVQKGAFDCLGVILGTCLCGSLKIPLLPGKEQCLLHIANGHVTLQSWKRFLDYAAATERWHHCKLLSKAEQNIDTGIRLHVATWFILRQPHQDKFQDQVTWGRLQRRLLHALSQEAEKEIINIAEPEMPALQPDHEFHPMTKDGRALREDCKPRAQMAIDRFISRGGGFCSKGMDASLKDVGLEAMCPSHYQRTTSDFMCRYLRRTQDDLKEELSQMTFKSVGVLCDASPKAKMDIWLPIIVMPNKIGLATLQRLSGLLPSNASPEDKIQVAEMVADSRTVNVAVACTKQKELKKKLPKALNAIKEEKLSARQEMKAVMNILSHVGMSMDSFFPTNPLTAKVCGMEERQVLKLNSENFAFIYNTRTGQSRWDVPMHSATQDIRLVLCADQGSPLYTCYQFLAFSGASIGLIRDELHKLHAHQGRVTSCTPVVKRMTMLCGWLFRARKTPWHTQGFGNQLSEAGERYMQTAKPGDVLMQMFQRDILKENDFEETSDEQLNFRRVMDILGKVCKFNSETFSWSRWCSFAHTAKRFQMSASLLLIFWSAMEVGKNPFKCENDGGQQVKNYDKTVDTCVKVLTSEEYFALFQIARNILEPYRELCLELQKTTNKKNALHDHTLKMNGGALEETLVNLATTACTARRLGMLPDIAVSGQVLTVKFRRADSLSSALNEGHKMLLASIHEMMQYVLYLRSAPAKAAALLSTVEDDPTKGAVLKAMEQEWRLVLALEETPAGANLLRQNCSFCSFQQYRELMTVHEKSGWKMTRETAALTAAWFPPTAWSASLESVFGDLQDATKRSGRSDCGSLPNLFAVGVRSLQNRLCVQDGSTGQVKLRADDWTGTQALGVKPKAFNPASAPACQHVAVDNILKPFPSTTAFFHNHHCLNFMLGLRKAQQQGKNPAEEAANFWVQGCFSSGMLLKYSGKFYLATGCTPAVLTAVCLKELPYLFKGPLPTATTDETRVPCHPADDVDLLSRDSSTPALVLDIGRNMIQQLRFDYEEVKLFDYTLHVCEGSLADKCGSAVVLRRGSQEFCLLCFLVHSELILSSSSASLTELLQKHDIQMPKNSTKPHKVRRILAMEKVQEVCSARTIAKLLARLDEADAKKKSKEREKNEDDVVAEAEVQWEELQEDPAAQACQELLARLDEEEEKEMEEKEKEEGEAAAPKPSTEQQNRASRALLSSTTSLPDDLVRMMPIPEGAAMHQTVHCDATLPHFQGKLLGNCFYEGKSTCAASFNPALPESELDKRRTSLRSIAASKRSRAQAYFIVWTRLCKATGSAPPAAKRQRCQ
ncbi:unnamed protein product [Symbiodinium sp. CCMP2592]|nr:unnamed protein product [Symbiodinium sp. CCMP2592]